MPWNDAKTPPPPPGELILDLPAWCRPGRPGGARAGECALKKTAK